MKITVIGAGALGKIWLHYLDRTGNSVHVWTRDTNCSYIEYEIVDLAKNKIAKYFDANSLLKLEQSDCILLTLKAPSILPALTRLFETLPLDIPILILHNGMGVSELVEAAFADRVHQLFYAITTQAAYCVDNSVIHSAQGITHIGQIPTCNGNEKYFCIERVKNDILPLLDQALGQVIWSDDIRAMQWQKLAINALINPLTVKYECLNGELHARQDELFFLNQELTGLFCHLSLAGECVPVSGATLLGKVLDVIEQTKNNYSSMYQDVKFKRATEIDFITGYILQKAEQLELSLPLHQALYEHIKIRMNTT